MDSIAHNVKDDSPSPVPMESLNLNDNHALSADDVAWADSCLIKLTEAPDLDWTLLERINVPTEPVSLFAADNGSNDHIELGDNHIFPSVQSVAAAFSSMMADDHSDFTDEDEDSIQGEDNEIERLKEKKLIMNALLPVHAEFPKVESTDLGFDLDPLTFEAGTSSSDEIFKIWDLGVSVEPDELTREMSLWMPSLVASDSAVEPLDALISGIAGLSLGSDF